MKNSYRFFENRECEYFPCHRGLDSFNCLFCYCPLYHKADCPGSPQYAERDGQPLKICTGCAFPHQPGNYDEIVGRLKA